MISCTSKHSNSDLDEIRNWLPLIQLCHHSVCAVGREYTNKELHDFCSLHTQLECQYVCFPAESIWSRLFAMLHRHTETAGAILGVLQVLLKED